MKIWIDISNAPHVRFFKDVIKYLEAEGEDLIVTARQFGDIHKLMDVYDIDFISVGKHGVSLYDKLKESTSRIYDLVDIISNERVDVALSKHSIELPRISFGLGIPSLYVLDNEHALAANKLTLPLCDRIITPNIIDMWKLMKFGADPNTIIPYNGTSELMHFKSFKYNDNVFKDLNLKLEHPKTILMRPEPSLASYLDADCTKSVLSPIVDDLKDHANILIYAIGCLLIHGNPCGLDVGQQAAGAESPRSSPATAVLQPPSPAMRGGGALYKNNIKLTVPASPMHIRKR